MVSFLQKTALVVAVLSVLYGILILVLYLFQDSILYHPSSANLYRQEMKQKLPLLKKVSYYLPSGEQLYAWYLKARKGKPTIVYFHGNTGSVERHAQRKIVQYFYDSGYGLLLPEYRGYGDLKGQPSQQKMEEDALTAVKYLNGLDIKNKHIVLYGHSMGTYMAVYTASQLGQKMTFHAVVLEAPFYSIAHTGREHFGGWIPYQSLLKNPYLSYRYINQVNTRLFIAHGKKDAIIPFSEGMKLYQYARGKKVLFASEKADHHNLADYGLFDSLKDWIDNNKY